MAGKNFWTMERFPVVYEGGEVRAVLVDTASFAQIELILDNLLNREEEPEDAILAASGVLKQLIAQAQRVDMMDETRFGAGGTMGHD